MGGKFLGLGSSTRQNTKHLTGCAGWPGRGLIAISTSALVAILAAQCCRPRFGGPLPQRLVSAHFLDPIPHCRLSLDMAFVFFGVVVTPLLPKSHELRQCEFSLLCFIFALPVLFMTRLFYCSSSGARSHRSVDCPFHG